MELIQISLEVALILLAVYLAFFKSFFSEHGKQIALKEHVEELTRKVESVKSEIDLITKTKFDLASNERSSILEFHSNYIDYRNSLLQLDPGVINGENFNSVGQFFTSTNTKELIVQNSSDELNLFVNDRELLKLKTDVFISCFEMRKIILHYFHQIRMEYLSHHYSLKATNSSEQMEITKKHYEVIQNVYAKFQEEKIKEYKKLHSDEYKLIEYLRKVFYKEIE